MTTLTSRVSASQDTLRSAVARLQAIPLGGAPSAVFAALRECAPVVGGMIGVLGDPMSGATISHVVGLPGGVLEGWTSTPLPILQRIMSPLVPASPGDLIPDRTALTGPLRDQVALLDVMRGAGLGESAGYKVAVRPTPSGRTEHRFLTLALDGDAAFTAADRELFRLLQPQIDATLSRMDVPLVASEPILAQIVEEGRLGYLCTSYAASIVELNARAHELSHAYLSAARVEGGRGWLGRFADRMLAETTGGQTWHLPRPDGCASLAISAFHLTKGTHAVAEPLVLLLLREEAAALFLPGGAAEVLSPRQREVGLQLARTGRSYKEIAAHLGISEGTVRKHVEHVYRAFGVSSRAELQARLR